MPLHTRRIQDCQQATYDLSDADSKAEWDALLVPGEPLTEWREGDRIFDRYTRTMLQVISPDRKTKAWAGVNCTLNLVTLGEDVIGNRFSQATNGNPLLYRLPVITDIGSPGVFLTGGLAGQQVYVMEIGQYIVESVAPLADPLMVIVPGVGGYAEVLSMIDTIYQGVTNDPTITVGGRFMNRFFGSTPVFFSGP